MRGKTDKLRSIIVGTIILFFAMCNNTSIGVSEIEYNQQMDIVSSVRVAITIDEIIESGDSFLEIEPELDDEGNSATIDNMTIQITSITIYNILLTIFMLLAVIIGIILGINYITSSVEAKAEIKQTLIPYFVAIVIMTGAFTIWKMVINILN